MAYSGAQANHSTIALAAQIPQATETTRHQLQVPQKFNTCLEGLRQTMFGPLSALAVSGFITGTLGFIVSTISRLDEKTQEIRECESRLKSFSRQLDDSYLQLKVWHSIWVGSQAFPRETYVYFWGSEELEEIEARVNSITELSSQITNVLYRPNNDKPTIYLPRSTIEDWHLLLDEEVAQLPSQRAMDHKKASLVRRIGFAFFSNTMLLEKVNRLKSHIEGLRDFTQWTFRLKHRCEPYEQVTSAELRRIADMKFFVGAISNFGNLLYKHRSNPYRSEWAVELAPPGPGHTLDLWSELDTDTLYIDFIVRDAAPDVQSKPIRLRLHVKDHRHLNHYSARLGSFALPVMQRVDEIVLDDQKLECHSEYDQFLSLSESPNGRSLPLRQMLAENTFSESHRKDLDVERADLVYGLGHWMVLLMDTSWSCNLCTCRIRSICLADACICHSFLPDSDPAHNPGCHHPTFAGDPLRLLGVTLAEVALALPIDMFEQEDLNFLVGGEAASRKGLLGMLRAKFGQNNITKAVSYCLDPELAELATSLHAGRLDKYCQNIVLP